MTPVEVLESPILTSSMFLSPLIHNTNFGYRDLSGPTYPEKFRYLFFKLFCLVHFDLHGLWSSVFCHLVALFCRHPIASQPRRRLLLPLAPLARLSFKTMLQHPSPWYHLSSPHRGTDPTSASAAHLSHRCTVHPDPTLTESVEQSHRVITWHHGCALLSLRHTAVSSFSIASRLCESCKRIPGADAN